MRKAFFVAIIAGALFASLAGAALAAPPEGRGRPEGVGGKPAKVALCHFDEEAGVHYLINIPEKAANKHLSKHEGDYLYDEAAGMTCNPEPEDEGDAVDDGENAIGDGGTGEEAA